MLGFFLPRWCNSAAGLSQPTALRLPSPPCAPVHTLHLHSRGWTVTESAQWSHFEKTPSVSFQPDQKAGLTYQVLLNVNSQAGEWAGRKLPRKEVMKGAGCTLGRCCSSLLISEHPHKPWRSGEKEMSSGKAGGILKPALTEEQFLKKQIILLKSMTRWTALGTHMNFCEFRALGNGAQ